MMDRVRAEISEKNIFETIYVDPPYLPSAILPPSLSVVDWSYLGLGGVAMPYHPLLSVNRGSYLLPRSYPLPLYPPLSKNDGVYLCLGQYIALVY
jgi:hypothetical protein